MLGKLFRYELKSTSRFFLFMYAAVILYALVCKLFFALSQVLDIMLIPSGVLMVFYVLGLIAMFVTTFIFLIVRFYKNLTGDEGYLMHTLPVNIYQHVLVKAVIAMMWTILSVIAAGISIFIMAFYKEIFSDIKTFFITLAESLKIYGDIRLIQIVVNVLILALISCISSYLMIYASIALGQMLRSHRLLGAIAAYIGLYFGNQAIMSIALIILSSTNSSVWLTLSNGGIELLTSYFILVATVFLAILCVAYYFCTCLVLRHKLNLE